MSTSTTSVEPQTEVNTIRLRRNARRRLSTPAPRQTHRIQFCHPFPPSLEALDLSTASSPTQVLASLRFLVLSYLAELEQRISQSPDLEHWQAKGELTIEEARQWSRETLDMLESLRNDVYSHLPDIHLSDISIEKLKSAWFDFPDVSAISNMRAHLPDLPDCISSKLDTVRTKFHDIDFHALDYIPTLSERLQTLQSHLSAMELPIGMLTSHTMLSDLVDTLLSSELVTDFLHTATTLEEDVEDVFERVTKEVAQAAKRSLDGVRLIDYSDLPEPWQNNSFVTQGYR